MRPRLLDLFCGAGGAAMGYHRAGFEVVGVDNRPQPNYPFEFIEADALEVPALFMQPSYFDAVHASPPCQAHSTIGKQQRARRYHDHPDLVAPTRELLVQTELPYVIENVIGCAPPERRPPLRLLVRAPTVHRHRLFETNWPLMSTPCSHHWQTPRFRSLDSRRKNIPASVVPNYGDLPGKRQRKIASVVGVHGNLNYAGELAIRERAMGIDWMSPYELTQAIPPAYTEYIGAHLLAVVEAGGVSDLILFLFGAWLGFTLGFCVAGLFVHRLDDDEPYQCPEPPDRDDWLARR